MNISHNALATTHTNAMTMMVQAIEPKSRALDLTYQAAAKTQTPETRDNHEQPQTCYEAHRLYSWADSSL